jgi:hypothetical protein
VKRLQGALILIAIAFFFVISILSTIVTTIYESIHIIAPLFFSGLGLIIIYLIYSELYFRSKKFNLIKDSISKHTDNCNELNHYIEELKTSYVNIESYNYGAGEISDQSRYNFKRKEWSKMSQSNQVYNCSSTVLKNASTQPIKYLCKYYNIENTEDTLAKFEKVLNDFISVEQGKNLLLQERDSILRSLSKSIPFLIQRFSKEKLIRKLGFEQVDISDTYIPTFSFQYVSAGGNSSSRFDIKLNIDNLNQLINYLNDLIKWTKSIAGQRALMTSQLRDKIKKRDNYKCRSCNLGIKEEPNLLLEIDHIIPLSKGGITTYDNLQTLCWKCNRKKGAKILN